MLFLPAWRATNVAAMGGFDVDASAWQAAVIGAGGTVTAADFSLVNAFIKGLKSNNLWIWDRLWVHCLGAPGNTAAGLIDLVNRATATATNSPTFLLHGGVTSDGATSYVKSGFNPSTSGVNYLQNSATAFTYQNTTRVASTSDSLGVSDASNIQTVISPRFTGNIAGGNVNNTAAAGSATGAVSDTLGLRLMSRTSGTALASYARGAQVGTAVSTSSTPPNAEVYILCVNGNGTPTQFETVQVAASGLGAGLTAGQVATFNTILETMLTGMGANG